VSRVRLVAAVLAIAVASVPSVVVANPGPASDFLYFDVGDGANCVWPAYGDEFAVTVYLGDLSMWTDEGIVEISFRLDRTFAGIKLGQTSYLYGPESGDVEGAGWTCTTGGECTGVMASGLIPIARIDYVYLGEPGVIVPVLHESEGASLTTCLGESWFWSSYELPIGGTVGVGMDAPGGCVGGSPVVDGSWGAIKALYRE